MKTVKSKCRRYFYFIVIAIPLLFFVILEAALRFYDYDPQPPLFIPAAEGSQAYLTSNPKVALRYFSENDDPPAPRKDYFLKHKPDGALRVFLMGGSTAVGWPYAENMMPSRLLAEKLSQAFPDRHIEVVNIAFSAINTYSLLDFVDEVLAQSPDLVLVYSGHNEFYGALGVGSTKSVGQQYWLVRSYLALQQSRTFRLLDNLITAMMGGGDEKVASPNGTLMQNMVQETAIPYGGPLYQAGLVQYENNLQALFERFQSAGIPVVVSELISNLRDQPPFVSLQGEGGEAAAEVYAQAQQLEQQGRYDEARDKYRRARDLDALRFRAPGQFNQVIHQLAAQYGVPVVPMQRYFEQASLHGIIGSTLMMEHLHPNAEGYFLFAEAFYDTLQQQRLLLDEWPAGTDHQAFRQAWPVTEYDQVLAGLRIKYLMDHWPFQPWERSGEGFVDYQPDSELEELAYQEIVGMTYPLDARRALAADYEFQGDIDSALRELQAMVAMYPFDVDLYREAAWLALKHERIDEAQAILLRAVKIEPIAGAHKWLGQIYLRKADHATAIQHLEQALELGMTDDPQTISLLSQAYVHIGQPKKAEEIFALLPEDGAVVDPPVTPSN